MNRFLPFDDDVSKIIEAGANDLFHRLENLDPEKLGMPYPCLHYYKSSHSRRLFFSIETSAHLLYKAIIMRGASPDKLVMMDYGAGIGTLFLLAKIIGFRYVIYNDHLEDWRMSAQLVAEAIGVRIDQYIVGDTPHCLSRLQEEGVRCDVVTSRNVVEHIYDLAAFYSQMAQMQPSAIIVSSTTANSSNPASVIKHWLWHRKWEKVYRGKRMVAIERQAPGLSTRRKQRLAAATRGLAAQELETAIETSRKTGKNPDPARFRTNTCDPSNGVWAEHLLYPHEYREMIDESKYSITFEAGFWDTHYQNRYMNTVGRLLNRIIAKGGTTAMRLAPFIYIIARPK